MVYQTKLTETVLSQIEKVSMVKWRNGDPVFGWEKHEIYEWDDAYLFISDEPTDEGIWHADAQSLFWGDWEEDCIQCTEEEFVAHCQRMLPRD